MTSNLGSGAVAERKNLGFAAQSSAEEYDREARAVNEALKQSFRPEFLNRIDEIVIFRKLSDESIRNIARLMLSEIAKRIEQQNISIEFDDEVVAYLGKEGFDPVYGARPLRRAMQRRIEDSLSTELLNGNIKPGDNVRAFMDDGNVKFSKIQPGV